MKEGILQKVRRDLPAVSLGEGATSAAGLALFFIWNLTDIYADPLIGAGSAAQGFAWLHVVSSLCNICGYLLAALLFSRLARSRARAVACAAAVAVGVATLALYAFSSWGLVDAGAALALYRGLTRLCSASVIVAWGMRFSRMEAHELTMRALAAFALAALGYLFLNALTGGVRAILLAALLPTSALLLCTAGNGCGEDAPRKEGGARPFLSLTWRVLIILFLMGIIAWTVIIGAQQRQALGPDIGSYVAVVSLAVAAALLLLAVSCRGMLSYSYIYKIVLPLVMAGVLLVGSFSLTMGVGFTLVSVGYTCLDLFCFVMVADACQRTGVNAAMAFGWYRALECSVPLFALGVLGVVEALGGTQGGSFLDSFGVACALAIAVSFLLDGRRVFEGGQRESSVEYPKIEIVQFAAQCEEAIRKYGLTEREAEVLGLIVRGRSVPHISERLHISKTTTKTHVAHIYQKFGVRDRQEMIDLIEMIEAPNG